MSMIVCILAIPNIKRSVITVLIIKDFVFTFVIYVCDKTVQNLFIGSTYLLNKDIVQTRFFQIKFPYESNIMQGFKNILGNIFVFNLQFTPLCYFLEPCNTGKLPQKVQ